MPDRHIPTFVVTQPLGALLPATALLGLTAGVIALAHLVERPETSRV